MRMPSAHLRASAGHRDPAQSIRLRSLALAPAPTQSVGPAARPIQRRIAVPAAALS
jgi:hypothetical protein